MAVARGDQLVQLGQRGDPGDGHEMASAEAADLAFDAAFLVCPSLPGLTEEGLEDVVTAYRDEALGLVAVATHQHPGDRRLQVVVADAARHAPEVLEGPDVSVDENLLGLVGIDAVEALARADSRMTNIRPMTVSSPPR